MNSKVAVLTVVGSSAVASGAGAYISRTVHEDAGIAGLGVLALIWSCAWLLAYLDTHPLEKP